ncbi:MAG: hypothetical protein K9G58_12125 [Bacteroidales bacterium]|nr:hypothetical protein [Bacteroidales bacterium]MCF8387468.1 hypothetical protein [Bacteroidales bacterium]MCF8398912.1 hypothetical protein [Bacteroidales bacterium]
MIRLFFCSLILVVLCGTTRAMSDTTVSEVIPDSAILKSWQLYEKTIYLGDDLFYLINGGAELYFEFGFEEVAALEYQKSGDTAIHVEIYLMQDPDAAFGIYSLFSNKFNMHADGSNRWIGEEYIFLRQGRYFVMIRKIKNANKNDMLWFAEILLQQIKAPSAISPWIREVILKQGKTHEEFYLIGGMIALHNHYYFGREDIFKIKQGIVFKNDHDILIKLKYPNQAIAKTMTGFIQNRMLEMQKFSLVKREGIELFLDNKNNLIRLENKNDFVNILIKQNK